VADLLHKPKGLSAIAGIILAAGDSSRFGAPKQLQAWGQGSCLEACIRTAETAGLDPLVLVLGDHFEEIFARTQFGRALVVRNPDWEKGQSTSLKAGLAALPADCFGAIFLLADQPQVSVNLVGAVKELAWQKDAVILPLINDRRANPVFFPARAFPRLMDLQGDQGGRAILGEFSAVQLPWLDDDMALDIDTREDYDRLSRIFFGKS
jgi:molybdenum cofactor cytidylyltransferase